LLVCLLVGLVAVAGPAGAADFTVPKASVTPSRGYTDDADGVRIDFRIAGTVSADVTIRVVGGGREVRRFLLTGVQPGDDKTQIWDGLNEDGVPVADDTYKVLIGDGTGGDQQAGTVSLRGHFFPVRGPHGTRGAVGRFHASRNGGRIHQGFDVTGHCGTPLAAVRAGTVVRNSFDPRLDGNFVVIRGLGERRSYLYAHMVRRSTFQRGDQVHLGDIVGHIGQTGNAAGTPCHLHFEVHLGKRRLDPEPFLRDWDSYS
jgi:murein DD-endopeptidase MepM/ murein hydrolase activator NlpD